MDSSHPDAAPAEAAAGISTLSSDGSGTPSGLNRRLEDDCSAAGCRDQLRRKTAAELLTEQLAWQRLKSKDLCPIFINSILLL